MPQYYNGLLGYDNDGNVVCKMAESYEASEDKMTWTFHLRQDGYFHSGRHCTAHDFEATFDRLLNTEKSAALHLERFLHRLCGCNRRLHLRHHPEGAQGVLPAGDCEAVGIRAES